MSHLTPPVGIEDHAQGPYTAPVTLVEFGDYECPYCGEAYRAIKAVQQAMGDRLRFVFRNFPLTEDHPHAAHAAALAEAAASIGKFWEAHDLLYERQDALTDADLVRYGLRLGLDDTAIADALRGRLDAKIKTDFTSGLHSGVNGTPTLFINGQRYDGSRDPESLLLALTRAAG